MKIFLLIIIKVYWFLIPKSKRKKCLFKTSCSNYVYKKTKDEGLVSGLKALMFRVKNCNHKYQIIEINDEKLLVSATQKVFKEDVINSSLLN